MKISLSVSPFGPFPGFYCAPLHSHASLSVINNKGGKWGEIRAGKWKVVKKQAGCPFAPPFLFLSLLFLFESRESLFPVAIQTFPSLLSFLRSAQDPTNNNNRTTLHDPWQRLLRSEASPSGKFQIPRKTNREFSIPPSNFFCFFFFLYPCLCCLCNHFISRREYASKMRSIDVEKSWPFGGGKELSKDEINGSLPPIVCKKYRWWLDEVARSKESEVAEDSGPEFRKPDLERVETGCLGEVSCLGFEDLRIKEGEADLGTGKAVLGLDEEPTVKICPVCGTFSASTVNAVNAHIDGCLVQASRAERRQTREKKVKSRMQKKRSIVELFAVAPQIVTVEGDDRDGDGGCEMDTDAVSKKMRRKKKLKELMEKMKKSQKKKKQKQQQQKKKMMKKRNSSGILSFLTRLDSKKVRFFSCSKIFNSIRVSIVLL